MKQINRRVSALEAWNGSRGPVRWIRLVVDGGETQEQALARYEAEHGAVGEDVGVIYRVLVGPDPLPVEAKAEGSALPNGSW